jgi:hypothetical protein
MAIKRTTHRSAKGTKLYAVRDNAGRFKDSFVWRDGTGRYHDVKVADPLVRPRGVTVEKIRKAVGKSGGGSLRKEK